MVMPLTIFECTTYSKLSCHTISYGILQCIIIIIYIKNITKREMLKQLITNV